MINNCMILAIIILYLDIIQYDNTGQVYVCSNGTHSILVKSKEFWKQSSLILS